MNIENYNESLTSELKQTEILTEKELNVLNNSMDRIKHSLKYTQMLRTNTEARVSVLNDVKHPDADSKYWQLMRELKGQSVDLFYINFDYKEKKIDKEELEEKISKNYNNIFEKKRDEIRLERTKYELLQMEIAAKEKIREISMWIEIQKELEPKMKFSKTDVNEHQLLSLGVRFVREYMSAISMNAQSSPSEARNLMGLLNTTLKTIQDNGLLDIFMSQSPPEVIEFVEKIGIIQQTKNLQNTSKFL